MRGSLEAVAVARDVASPSPLKAPSALDMMRYQRLSPDCLPLANGSGGASRKPASRSCKDDDAPAVATDSSRLASYLSASPLEPKPLRARAPQPSSSSAGPSPARDHAHHPSFPSDSSDTASPSSTGGTVPAAAGVGDVLLQWGHNKRSRGRRDAAAAPSPQRRQAGGKIQRRASAPAEKLMPPPGASYTRGSNLRATSSFPARGGGGGGGAGDGHHHHRSAEERSGGPPRAEKRSPDRAHKPKVDAGMHPDSKNHSHIHHQDHQSDHHHHHDSPLVAANGSLAGEKLSLEHFEWPRIYISLSRKEKEDDFLAMKGTKLPQRPKKRAKNVDKTLQYVFPGMWLSDLTRGRYEVREKKCVKKKRRGLKGMESMDSDSD